MINVYVFLPHVCAFEGTLNNCALHKKKFFKQIFKRFLLIKDEASILFHNFTLIADRGELATGVISVCAGTFTAFG